MTKLNKGEIHAKEDTMPTATTTWPKNSFGNLLRKYRKRAGLSQQQLSGYLAISPKRISKWETGASDPPQDPEFYDRLQTVPGFSEADIALLMEAREVDESARVVSKRHAVIEDDEVVLEDSVLTALADFVQKLIEEKAKAQQKIAEVIERKGIFGKPNKRDVTRVEAAKAVDDMAALLANLVKNSLVKNYSKLGVFNHKIAIEAKKAMIERIYDLLGEVQELEELSSQELEELTSEVVASTVVEIMTMYPEIVLQEFVQPSKYAAEDSSTAVEEAPDILTESSQIGVSISTEEALNGLKEYPVPIHYPHTLPDHGAHIVAEGKWGEKQHDHLITLKEAAALYPNEVSYGDVLRWHYSGRLEEKGRQWLARPGGRSIPLVSQNQLAYLKDHRPPVGKQISKHRRLRSRTT